MSVSDFIDSGSLLTNSLPCFAEHCLVDCSFAGDGNAIYYGYQNGYPALGGNDHKAGYSFFRFKLNKKWWGDAKCLTYACLDF